MKALSLSSLFLIGVGILGPQGVEALNIGKVKVVNNCKSSADVILSTDEEVGECPDWFAKNEKETYGVNILGGGGAVFVPIPQNCGSFIKVNGNASNPQNVNVGYLITLGPGFAGECAIASVKKMSK